MSSDLGKYLAFEAKHLILHIVLAAPCPYIPGLLGQPKSSSNFYLIFETKPGPGHFPLDSGGADIEFAVVGLAGCFVINLVPELTFLNPAGKQKKQEVPSNNGFCQRHAPTFQLCCANPRTSVLSIALEHMGMVMTFPYLAKICQKTLIWPRRQHVCNIRSETYPI